MLTVTIQEAKTNLTRLVEQAANGESFVIAEAGKPLVKVISIAPQPSRPRLGFMQGQGKVPDDFDTLGQAEIIALLSGDAA